MHITDWSPVSQSGALNLRSKIIDPELNHGVSFDFGS